MTSNNPFECVQQILGKENIMILEHNEGCPFADLPLFGMNVGDNYSQVGRLVGCIKTMILITDFHSSHTIIELRFKSPCIALWNFHTMFDWRFGLYVVIWTYLFCQENVEIL